ncbi:MAG: DUF2867 domain-containing protein [Alphaproteobacteria bacterium]|nr:DUF2867 domain-containing protein [Alphaproteobacteria bacterium]
MINYTNIINTFPSIHIPNDHGAPIDISVIAQLGHGAGNHLFANVTSHQKHHDNFVDELDEPSAKLSDINLELGDPASLYSFAVGPKGHPFHRHAGNRIFIAVSGSGGAQLRFSTATAEQIQEDPNNFIKALHFINIPPDNLFTVRFGGEVWHQFYPLSKNTLHPVFFALSCHTNELGGNLTDELKDKVIAKNADIPSLTELLPKTVTDILNSKEFQNETVPTTTLAMDAPAGTVHRAVCDSVRGSMGLIRQMTVSWNAPKAYISKTGERREVIEKHEAPQNSLLKEHLKDRHIHHEDTFSLTVSETLYASASEILEHVLEGFLMNAPRGVARLMLIRNILVKPIGLRTSPLGCPASSLLSDDSQNVFASKYPVLDQNVNRDDSHAQVILGANDKHLQFRSCMSVEKLDDGSTEISMGTRVHCKNWCGRFYMAVINQIHKHYISPAMLRTASDYAVHKVQDTTKQLVT